MKINLPTKITILRIVISILLFVGIFILYYLDYFKVLDISNFNLVWVTNSYTVDDVDLIIKEGICVNLFNLIILIIFLFASLTDFVDGYLARKNNMVTDLGKFLDPLADKILINGMMIFLSLNFPSLESDLKFPFFLVIIMIVRDLVIDSLRFMAAKKNIVIAANIYGKMKTVLEMVAISLILLNGFPFSFLDKNFPSLTHISEIVCYLACFMSLFSGFIYLKDNFKNIFNEKK